MYYIYEISNSVTGRKYIGQTLNHITRYDAHMNNLKKGIHKERLMQRDFVLYGETSFNYRIIDLANDHEDAIRREKHHMIINKTYEEDFGYNCQDAYFNKYQNNKPPINSHNCFYLRLKEKGMSFTELASKTGISRRTLIRNLNHLQIFSVKEFEKLITVLELDKIEVAKYMGWTKKETDSLGKPQWIQNFMKLDKESQDKVISFCKQLIQSNVVAQEVN